MTKKYKTLTEKWAAEDAAKAASKAKSAPAPTKKAPVKKQSLREMLMDRKRVIDEASSSSRKPTSRKKR